MSNSTEKTDYYEQFYIQYFNTINNGYNIDGGGQINHIVSKETIHKREATKQANKPFRQPYHLSDELKKRQSLSRRNSPLY